MPTVTRICIPTICWAFPIPMCRDRRKSKHVRNTGIYLFAQDSWKIRPNLTLNYGLRWELNPPIYDAGMRYQTFRPGQATTTYPCQLSAASRRRSAIRCQLHDRTVQRRLYFRSAWSFPETKVFPGLDRQLLQVVCSAHRHRLEIRGKMARPAFAPALGMFYNPIEQLVLEQFGASLPSEAASCFPKTLFNTPFISQDGQTTVPNPFNGILTPRSRARRWTGHHSVPSCCLENFSPTCVRNTRSQYNLTDPARDWQGHDTEVGYVGSQGHRLLATQDINYGNAQTCLDLNNISNLTGRREVWHAGRSLPTVSFHHRRPVKSRLG